MKILKYIILIFSLLLSGCGVSLEEFKEAEKVCEHHGGLHYYSPPFHLNDNFVGDVTCSDELIIKSHWINQQTEIKE